MGGQERVLHSSRNSFRVNAKFLILDWSASIPFEARLTSASEISCHPKIGLTLEPIPGSMLNSEGEDRAIG